MKKKNIIGICGSASENSANLFILKWFSKLNQSEFNLEIVNDLTELPHFRTELTDNNIPEKIIVLRDKIANADGVIFSTPEYIFSVPSGLKNLIEWFVSTTVFSNKPIAMITASASGIKGHEELKLIMETIGAKFNSDSCLLIQGIKGKIDTKNKIINTETETELQKLFESFKILMQESL